MKNTLIVLTFLGLSGFFVADQLPRAQAALQEGPMASVVGMFQNPIATAVVHATDFGQMLDVLVSVHAKSPVRVNSITCTPASGAGSLDTESKLRVDRTFSPGSSEHFKVKGTPTVGGYRCTVLATEMRPRG